jgi:hypothetical protein
MPYFTQKNILFIHIPKTGGTTIENLLKENDKMILYSSFNNNLLPFPYNKTSLQHQYYKTIYKYKNLCNINFNNSLKIITIVRNPYNRIISGLFWDKLINSESTQNEVYKKIQNYISNTHYDNHNIPQYKFIIDDNNIIKNIKIFKTESLNEDIKEYGYKIIKNFHVSNNTDYKKYLNNESINLINIFYKKDFELFDYNMIQVNFKQKNINKINWYAYKKHFKKNKNEIISIKNTILKINTNYSLKLNDSQKKYIKINTKFYIKNEINDYYIINI